MKDYRVLIHHKAYDKATAYLADLKAGQTAGKYLQALLHDQDLAKISPTAFLEALSRTKYPQIFAESAIFGDGSDWTLTELSILGDINIAVPVTVYDNGLHHNPQVYDEPFQATLLFVPGALLQNGRNQMPVDWPEVVQAGEIQQKAYNQLYERRLLPSFIYANELAKEQNKQAFITLPGLGCGQFAGKFRGQLGEAFKEALQYLLKEHGQNFSHLKAVYYDPYQECENERHKIHDIQFLVRPLSKGNQHKPQLCPPTHYAEMGDNFSDCILFSVVAWDHVSWPGNDFYIGSRATDDGVKAAATNTMAVMTGVEGYYNPQRTQYQSPDTYHNWNAVIQTQQITLNVQDNLTVY